MNAVENIRAALADATNRPWIGAGPSFGAPHAEYLDSVVEDVDNDDAATICRDTETSDALYIAACNPAAMAEVLAHIDRQAAEIARLEADAARYQWLRRGQKWSVIDGIGDTLRAESLDAAIDEAKSMTDEEVTKVHLASVFALRLQMIGNIPHLLGLCMDDTLDGVQVIHYKPS